MRAGTGPAADATIVTLEVFGRGVRDDARERGLLRRRREELGLRRIRAEAQFDEHRRHERADKHTETGLLHSEARTRMNLSEMTLHDLSEIGRFTEVFVLLHVAENETKRIVRGNLGRPFELHGLVFHLF